MAPELLAVALEQLPGVRAVTPTGATAAALGTAGLAVRCASLQELSDGAAEAVVLLDDELTVAGQHAEGLLAEVARVLGVGGLVLVSVRGRVHAAATSPAAQGRRTFDAAELARLLGHRGFAVELLCAPGAASTLAGRGAVYEPDLDRQPGLLDAGPKVVALGRRHAGDQARSAAFFASLPRKVIAAAVICRDEAGRLLVVHDTFKRHWTIPGGVVDADEDPRAGAERETREEAGLQVRAERLLGVFSSSWPDRLVLVYDAAAPDAAAPLIPLHAHEIDAVEWVPLDDALQRLAPSIAEQVRRCLSDPGGTWRA